MRYNTVGTVRSWSSCFSSRRKNGSSVPALNALWSQETLRLGIHVDFTLTHITNLNIVANQIHPCKASVFPVSSGLFQDNVFWHMAKPVQAWFKEHEIKHLVGYTGQTKQMHGGSSFSSKNSKDPLLTSWCWIPEYISRGFVESITQWAVMGTYTIVCRWF